MKDERSWQSALNGSVVSLALGLLVGGTTLNLRPEFLLVALSESSVNRLCEWNSSRPRPRSTLLPVPKSYPNALGSEAP